ncbi:hypothetical protein AeMF1_017513 [Aphanomyces euteiches]|nr:hypothetical protein AeMF1_017513 [Aphanomyces euteiches]KAH9184800.1 hypothetical protein AeNC1_013224 [Aphanomyces euteiches]
MRLFVPLTLAASAVVAFKQLGQDSQGMAHDQLSMDSAINDLHQVASAASYGSMTRRLAPDQGGHGGSSGYRRPSPADLKQRMEQNSKRTITRTQSLPIIKWRTLPKPVANNMRQYQEAKGGDSRRLTHQRSA